MFNNILFDLDGTLTDPKVGITRSMQFALTQLGHTPPAMEDLLWCIGPPLKENFVRLLQTDDEALLAQAVAYFRLQYDDTGKFENSVYPEIPTALQYIQAAGYRLFVATSKVNHMAQDILDHFHLTPFFEAVYGSEPNGRYADKGELIAHLLQTEQLDPAETLMVGDRKHDIIGARKNKVKVTAVAYGYGSAEEFAVAQPDFICQTPLALAQWLVDGSNKHSPSF